jgi:hypothetical protein
MLDPYGENVGKGTRSRDLTCYWENDYRVPSVEVVLRTHEVVVAFSTCEKSENLPEYQLCVLYFFDVI